MNLLVTGATGYIGGRLTPRLLEAGYAVRCMVRKPERLGGQAWQGVDVVAGDAFDAESLKRACEGIDTAYYLIHSMRAGETGFAERDRRAANNFAEAAKDAGVRRIIYLGGLGSSSEHLSPHLVSRHQVGDRLRESGVSVTEFRAAIIVGAGSLSFQMIRYLAERLPVMICPRWLNSKVQPIAIHDVLEYLVQALVTEASRDRIIEIGGSSILSYGDMIREYARIRGLKRYLIHVPVLTPRLSSYWVDLVTPIPASISHPLIEGLRNDVVCQDTSALKLFAIKPMSYSEAVQVALQETATENATISSPSH